LSDMLKYATSGELGRVHQHPDNAARIVAQGPSEDRAVGGGERLGGAERLAEHPHRVGTDTLVLVHAAPLIPTPLRVHRMRGPDGRGSAGRPFIHGGVADLARGGASFGSRACPRRRYVPRRNRGQPRPSAGAGGRYNERMGSVPVKLVAILVLAVQVIAGVSPGRSVWCLGLDGGCAASEPQGRVEERGCCQGCHEAKEAPEPVTHDRGCPAGCDCCFEIYIPALPTLAEGPQAARDQDRCVVLLCLQKFPECWGSVSAHPPSQRVAPPPDGMSLVRARALRSVRLLV
jgi:hypothetical protein